MSTRHRSSPSTSSRPRTSSRRTDTDSSATASARIAAQRSASSRPAVRRRSACRATTGARRGSSSHAIRSECEFSWSSRPRMRSRSGAGDASSRSMAAIFAGPSASRTYRRNPPWSASNSPRSRSACSVERNSLTTPDIACVALRSIASSRASRYRRLSAMPARSWTSVSPAVVRGSDRERSSAARSPSQVSCSRPTSTIQVGADNQPSEASPAIATTIQRGSRRPQRHRRRSCRGSLTATPAAPATARASRGARSAPSVPSRR